MGGHHARLRKPRPGAGQRHAAAALPVLSVSHTLFPNTNQVISLIPFAVTVRLTPLSGQTFDLSGIDWSRTMLFTLVGIFVLNSTSCLVRWFLRKYPGNAGCSPTEKEAFEHAIGKDAVYTCNTKIHTCNRKNNTRTDLTMARIN